MSESKPAIPSIKSELILIFIMLALALGIVLYNLDKPMAHADRLEAERAEFYRAADCALTVREGEMPPLKAVENPETGEIQLVSKCKPGENGYVVLPKAKSVTALPTLGGQ